MLRVIPMRDQAICASLPQAQQFLFVDQQDQQVNLIDNPIDSWNCQAKAQVIALLKQMGATQIQLAEVGEGLLRSLLSAGIHVLQTWSQGEDLPPRFRLLTQADLVAQRSQEHTCCGACQD